MMTELMQKALSRVSEMPAADQDVFATRLLESIEALADERLWAEKFARSPDTLVKMADDARQEIAEGRTYPLEDIL